MFSYIVKRLLLMIPTFFVISCIIFLVVNMAPGRPSPVQASTEGTSDPNANMNEAYREFNRQFKLDKPVLFNTRFLLSIENVKKELLYRAAPLRKENPLEANPNYFTLLSSAEEKLQDWGRDCVPHLIEILKTEKDPELLFVTTQWLVSNSQRILLSDKSKSANDQYKEINKQIAQENAIIQKRVYKEEDSQEVRDKIHQEWIDWYGEKQTEFQRTATGKVGMFFTETRFYNYWTKLLQFDFGISHVTKKPVFETVLEKAQISAMISFVGLLLAYLIAIPIGIFSSVKRGSKADNAMTIFLFMLYALPSFFAATLALKYFGGKGADWFYLFPTGGYHGENYDSLAPHNQIVNIIWHLALPITMVTYGALAALSRYARSGLLEVVNADYIRTARAKGLNEREVILGHAVRNGMIPIITLMGTLLPVVVSGSIVIEYIFNIPGIGLHMLSSIQNRDYNTIMCVSLISSVLTLIGVLLSDISYALLDPRITYN